MINQTTVYTVEIDWQSKGVPRSEYPVASELMHAALQDSQFHGYLYSTAVRPSSRRMTLAFQTRASAQTFLALWQAASTFTEFIESEELDDE